MKSKVFFLLLICFAQSNLSAQACVDSVRFEDTPQYELYDAIKAETKSEEEAIGKFSKISDLGREILEFREFEIDKIRPDDLKELIQKWEDGESLLAQRLLLVFAFSRVEYIKERGYYKYFEDFLTNNKKYCWLDEANFYFKFAEYKLRLSQVFPKDLESEELVYSLREILWYSGEDLFLQDYFNLLRVGGTKLAKEELKIWSGENQSNNFCNNLAHCIERIRIEFENRKKRYSKNILTNVQIFECEGKYVNFSGKSIMIDLC